MNENLKQKVIKFLPVIVAILCIFIVIITTLIFTLGRRNNKDTVGLYLDPNNPIPVKQNNLYGYISASDGKQLINFLYTDAKAFYGDYAIVQIKENETNKYCIIDKKGNIKLSSASAIKYISDYDLYVVDNRLYNNNLKALTDDSMKVAYKDMGFFSYIKYNNDNKALEGGIINEDGKKIYSYKFKNEEEFFTCTISEVNKDLEETYAKINIDNKKYAIINLKNGKMVYDFTDKTILVDNDNIFQISSNGSLESILCFYNNKIAYQESRNIEISYYDVNKKILQLYDSTQDYSSRYSYYDLKKNKLLSEKPEKSVIDTIESLTGYKSFTIDNKHGIKKGNKTVLPCEYDDIQFLSAGTFNYLKDKINKELVLVKKDNKYSVTNIKNKKSVFDINCASIDSYSHSTFIKAKVSDSKATCVYNLLTGKTKNFDSDCQVVVYSNYITVTVDNTKTYYNTELEEIYKQ